VTQNQDQKGGEEMNFDSFGSQPLMTHPTYMPAPSRRSVWTEEPSEAIALEKTRST
jgi:hypothetical protein